MDRTDQSTTTIRQLIAVDRVLSTPRCMMSAPPSPKPSVESDDRPSTSESAQQMKKSGHSRSISFEDTKPRENSPRRRSIQFNVGAAEAQLTRSLSSKEKRLSFGGDQLIREEEDDDDSTEREQRHQSVPRGPSPPPPK